MTAGVDVDVWRVDLAAPADGACLSAVERERAARFRFDRDRRRFVAARAALRHVLGARLGVAARDVEIVAGAHGKPHVPGEAVSFNVSHSDDVALIAVGDGVGVGVGVDVEHHRDLEHDVLAARFFSPAENEALRAIADATARRAAFFRCWTRKEAYVKARGEGLGIDLSSFDVSVGEGEPARLLCVRGEPAGEAARWSLVDLAGLAGLEGGAAACLAVEGPVGALVCSRWFNGEPRGGE